MGTHLNYVKVVEEAFSKLGIDSKDAKAAIPGAWAIQRGSATIQVMLNSSPGASGEQRTISLMAKIMEIPRKGHKDFFRKLLEMNHSFITERFEIFDSSVYISSARHLEGIEAQEVAIMISELAETADYLDDKLKKEYAS